MEKMASSELAYWMAFYQIEERETKEAIEKAKQEARGT